jgi:sugar phosphate isomerase/epimerase
MPLDEILQILSDIGYDGYLTNEILPEPNPDSAARQVVNFLSLKLGGNQATLS